MQVSVFHVTDHFQIRVMEAKGAHLQVSNMRLRQRKIPNEGNAF